jgi:hypothetical protein
MVTNMNRNVYAAVTLGLISVAIPLRAANGPHAGTDRQSKVVWTNDDLDNLHGLGLISIIGRDDDEKPISAPVPALYAKNQDPEWYAEQAGKLRDELEFRQAQLRDYQQALDDARNLGKSTGGINLVEEDFATTPDAGVEILQQRVSETQSEFGELEDLARRNYIETGTLRGQ